MVASVSAAFLLGATAPAVLAENPFEAQALTSGYQLADAGKTKEGKCGEAKCGGDAEKSKADKEGRCGEDHKADKEGACGEDAEKTKEGKCGEAKCGGDKAEG